MRYDAYLPLGDIESYSGKEALVMGKGWYVSKRHCWPLVRGGGRLPAECRCSQPPGDRLTEAWDRCVLWHSYELLLDGKWVKCTPAFNKSLCDKFGLKTLDFDGKTDSLFHAYDKVGNKHMEYGGPF